MKPDRVRRWTLFADLGWATIACFIAEAMRYGAFWNSPDPTVRYTLLPFLATALVAWTLLSSMIDLTCFRGGWRFPVVVSQTFLATSGLMCLLFAAGYLRREYVSRLALSYFGILLFGGFVAVRYVARSLLLARYRAGRNRRVVVVGTGRIARELVLKINRHPEMLWQVVGVLCPEGDDNLGSASSEKTVTLPAVGVSDLLAAHDVSDVILALSNPSLPEVLSFAGRCREQGIMVSIVPQPYELYLSKPALVDLDGIPVLELHEEYTSNFFFQWKRLLDMVLASMFSVVAVPILLVPVVRLKHTKGRAFCWETRCGHSGKPFSMLRLNVDRHSPHASRFERTLEALSLTELPQLWNVLRGDMSLVGPRPEPPKRVYRYSDWQRRRLTVKPGMTGLAQVQGLREQHSSEDKTHYDLQYLLNCSPWMDLSLLLQTIWTLAVRSRRRPDSDPVVGAESAANPLGAIHSPIEEEILENAHRS